MHVLKRKLSGRKMFYIGLGKKKGSNFAEACWDKSVDEAVQYESPEEAVEAAKILFPHLLYRHLVEPEEAA